MRTDELDFDLPPILIAQAPVADRSASRLLHYRRADRSIGHRRFTELPSLLKRGDVLVFNDARVIPARFMLEKPTGGKVDGLFISVGPDGFWNVLLKNVGPVKPDMRMRFIDEPNLFARAIEKVGDEYQLAVESSEPALAILSRVGRMPLPPYIKREKWHDERDDLDRERYQTVYAAHSGSIAAPTAGLHFTDELLKELDQAGVERTFITLHVGLGTFKPVSADRLEDHPMHSEAYSIEPDAADALNRAKSEGRRLIAVGTTSARVLESQPADRPFEPKSSQTSIFIFPPYEWKHVNGLVTNFHLPRSTLVALVAAMTGLDEQRRIYQIAVQERYRFFSYGDAMWVE